LYHWFTLRSREHIQDKILLVRIERDNMDTLYKCQFRKGET